MLTDARLGELAAAMMTVGGVEAVALGGSRARGTHRPTPMSTSASTTGPRSTSMACGCWPPRSRMGGTGVPPS